MSTGESARGWVAAGLCVQGNAARVVDRLFRATGEEERQVPGKQIYALLYRLQRCSDWICSMRDPQQKPQEEPIPF